MFEDAPDHVATGSESLAEFARNVGMDNPEHAWLLDPRDVWVKNPFYSGPPVPHPEDDSGDFQHLDEGITPEAEMKVIEEAAHAYSKSLGEVEVPF